ncbi:hypothetical protein [Aestuariispira insulae]|uniref:Tellurite resistance protein TerB n=1 Tax=Aestuariispira insulae TaxID=1461337 RepID=A0A3D9HPC1_9PROT|nr:hypothetical protein [Aestuariispira insulae]RED50736.1 hypothetical protein DFP90_1047 [Aestuariispira insulae]
MRVLTGIVDILGDLLIHAYRSYSAAKANREMQEAREAQRMPHELDRKAVYLNQIARDAIDCVDDPCVAATTMMCAIADRGRGLEPAQLDKIQAYIAQLFSISAVEAGDLLSLARWTMRSAHSVEDCLNRLGFVIHQRCSPEEKIQLLEMLHFAASLGQTAHERHYQAITRLKYRLGI